MTADDFTETQRAEAMNICEQYGMVPGPSFDDCELDILVTGNWAFAATAATAATITIPSVAAGDRLLDAAGHLDVDFEAPVPVNLRALRVGRDSGIGSFAGPLSGTEQYRFYVPQLAHHDQATIEFDAHAIGTWDPTDALQVRVDDVTVTGVDFTIASAGQLDSGVAYRTVHVSVPVDHHTGQLAVTVDGVGLSAGAGQGFGIDNVEVQARLVPAQSFPVALGTDGTPTALRQPTLGSGSGVLETRGSQDRYQLSVPAGRDLFLDWQTTSMTVSWSLLTPEGAVVAGGSSADGDARVEDLTGDHVLAVDVAGANPAPVQTYSLDVMVAPDPQRFGLSLPGPVVLPDYLASPAEADGAGVLETKASTDVYAFTVAGQDRSIIVDPTTCPADGWRKRLTWAVYTQSSALVAEGTCSRRTVTSLDAGDYELRVSPQRETPGAYTIVVSQEGPVVSFTSEPPWATNQKPCPSASPPTRPRPASSASSTPRPPPARSGPAPAPTPTPTWPTGSTPSGSEPWTSTGTADPPSCTGSPSTPWPRTSRSPASHRRSPTSPVPSWSTRQTRPA